MKVLVFEQVLVQKRQQLVYEFLLLVVLVQVFQLVQFRRYRECFFFFFVFVFVFVFRLCIFFFFYFFFFGVFCFVVLRFGFLFGVFFCVLFVRRVAKKLVTALSDSSVTAKKVCKNGSAKKAQKNVVVWCVLFMEMFVLRLDFFFFFGGFTFFFLLFFGVMHAILVFVHVVHVYYIDGCELHLWLFTKHVVVMTTTISFFFFSCLIRYC